MAVCPTSCHRKAGWPQVLREALTGRAASGSGLNGELGRPRPVPVFCRAPFHLQRVRAQRVEPGRAVPPEPGRGQRGSGPGLLALQPPQPSSGPGGRGAAPGLARFPSRSLRASGSGQCAEGSQLAVPLPAQTFLLWLPVGTRSLQ